ncbi:hypothetical protein CJ198_12130 [Brevibacterium luteolum]|uniref:Uncharacterized protein n=1 Tax=Brevibacterium luteolum TaxID=199591 RepID=A0A2N6PF22_9MICO|nr:hypothetical protein CJ198_12130 [Brevibacterium luteolum]
MIFEKPVATCRGVAEETPVGAPWESREMPTTSRRVSSPSLLRTARRVPSGETPMLVTMRPPRNGTATSVRSPLRLIAWMRPSEAVSAAHSQPSLSKDRLA